MPRKQKTIGDLYLEMGNRFDRMEKKLENTATKDELRQLTNTVDGLAKNVKDFQAELASNQSAHDRMQKHIESLDKRLTRVELRTGVRTHIAK